MSAIRVGIAGCGFIGTVHALAIQSAVAGGLAEGELVALGDQDATKAEGLAGLCEARPAVFVEDWPGFLKSVDAVWVCTPTSSHLELVARASAAGKAIYCEKPLATNLPTAEALVAAVDRARVPNQVGLVLRSAPGTRVLETELRAGGPQVVMSALMRDDQYFPIQGIYGSTWRADVAVSGGGTLIEHSIHDVDLLSWLLGPIERVSARVANFAGHAGVEDLAVVTLEHEAGAVSNLMSVWHRITSRPSTRRLEVFTEDSLLTLKDEHHGPVVIQTSEGVRQASMLAEDEQFMSRLGAPDELKAPLVSYAIADASFLRSLAAGEPASPGVDVALEAHRVVDAAYRSAAAGGEPVELGGRWS
jgi:predicted dehydrogenase